jgi:hypothetical protein
VKRLETETYMYNHCYLQALQSVTCNVILKIIEDEFQCVIIFMSSEMCTDDRRHTFGNYSIMKLGKCFVCVERTSN